MTSTTAPAHHPPGVGTASTDGARTAGAVLALGGAAFAVSLVVNPGPDVTDVHDAAWQTGHLLTAAAFLLVCVGLPVLWTASGRTLGRLGMLGVAALTVRAALSAGSQLYQAWTLPALARHDLPLGADAPLSSVYAGHSDAVSLVLAVGMLGLVVALWRAGATLRGPAAVLLAAAVGEVVLTPLALVAFAVLFTWVGLRAARGGDVAQPLRRRARR